MSKLGKKLILTAVILSLLGTSAQPVFSVSGNLSRETEGKVVLAEVEESEEEKEAAATEESKKTPETEAAQEKEPSAVSSEEGSSEEASDEKDSDDNKEETASKEPSSKETGSRESSSKETSARESSSKETSAKESSSKETSARESSSRETSAKESSSKETSAKESSSKETSARESSSKETKPVKKWPLADGIWKVHSDTDNRMFYIVEDDKGNKMSGLVVDGDELTATITLTGVGYDYLYMGTIEEAEKADRSEWVKYNEVNGYYTYTLKLSALNKDLQIASHSKRLDQWYQHTIIFYSKNAELIKAKETPKESEESGKPGKPSETKESIEVPVIVPSKPREDKPGRETKPGKEEKTEESDTGVKQSEFHNDHKADKESKNKDDSDKSTYSVNNATSLKDGVYTPDGFSWSGGSGRLSYIRCDKLTVRDGKVYATIEFGSPNYDQLKANGMIYYKSGGGNSTFVIPVELNKNNTIIGRTVAMSTPHWIAYTIFISKSLGEDGKKPADSEEKDKVKEEMAESAPDILGLETEKAEEGTETTKAADKAEYFRIFSYKDGIKLIQVDMTSGTYLEEKEESGQEESKSRDNKKSDAGKKKKASEQKKETSSEGVQYDEEGHAILKSQSVVTRELYQNPVVNYLVVPKGVEVPAGVEKDYIIIKQPVKHSFSASRQALRFLNRIGRLKKVTSLGIKQERIHSEYLKRRIKKDKVRLAGSLRELNYAALVLAKTDLAILPAGVLPAALDTSDQAKLSPERQKAKAEEKIRNYQELVGHFSSLSIPVLVNRANDEKTALGKVEWVKVYGAVYGCEEEASRWYDQCLKEAKKEKKEKNTH